MNAHHQPDARLTGYVTVDVDGWLFGLPIARVQDVFVPERLTRVPLAPAEIAGVLNLRGRIVTAVDLRRRLGLAPRPAAGPVMAVGIESRGESYGLVVDAVAEVLTLPDEACEPCPAHLQAGLAAVSCGIVRLDARLLLMLDVDRVLEASNSAAAA